MNELARETVACARANRAKGMEVMQVMSERVILDLADEIDRLTFALHRMRAHPDYEYATTQTARKSGDDPRAGLGGDGWEPNDVVENHRYEEGEVVGQHWRNWERFQFHEDNHWRRKRTAGEVPR